MRNLLFCLCYIFVFVFGCDSRNSKNIFKNYNHRFNNNSNFYFDKNDIDDFDKIYFLNFEENLKNKIKDTFSINSIARSIKLIPIETSDDFLLYNDVIKIEKINDGYLISSSSIFTAFHSIMLFDSAGYFMNYLQKIGQGPKELPYISEWSYNYSAQLLVASTGYQIILYSFEDNTSNKYTLNGFFSDFCLLNDGSIVCLPSVFGKEDAGAPYLHFLNQEGKIVRSICYNQKRNIAYDFPEGKTLAHAEKYSLYPSYSGDVIFKDIFNDTIYKIRSMDEINPYIILHKGEFTPTLKDVNNPTTSAQKVKLTQILDTKKYFIITYEYKSDIYTSIWDKQTLRLIANTIHPSRPSKLSNFIGYTNYLTHTGKKIVISISSYFDGKLYCVIDAEQAMEILPEIKEDDNPVIMVVEL